MTDQSNDDDERTKMMHLYLEKFRQGKKYVLEKNIRDELREKEKDKKNKVIKRTKKKRIFEDVPDFDKLREFDPNINIENRNFLFDAGMASVLRKITDKLNENGYPNDIIKQCKDLFHLILENDVESAKEKLFTIAEEGCATNDSHGIEGYHLLRAFIRIMFAVYPLE